MRARVQHSPVIRLCRVFEYYQYSCTDNGWHLYSSSVAVHSSAHVPPLGPEKAASYLRSVQLLQYKAGNMGNMVQQITIEGH